MRRVLYGGGTFVTGDAVAEALLDYAGVLATTVRADTLHVPALTDDGPSTVELLVGPASQLMTEPVEVSGTLDDEDFLADIAQRMRSSDPGATGMAGATDSPEQATFFDDL